MAKDANRLSFSPQSLVGFKFLPTPVEAFQFLPTNLFFIFIFFLPTNLNKAEM